MIRVFFSEDGYYVAGEGIEISRSCFPALNVSGNRVFLPLHHEYKILYLALEEIIEANIQEEVMVYGATRIIDEINGNISPLDEINAKWLEILKRNIIPRIKAVIFFRKKSATDVRQALQETHGSMLRSIDHRTLEQIIERQAEQRQTAQVVAKKSRLQRFRDHWFGDNNGNR